MTLMTIRLELGRTREFPEGDSGHGYEFIAPLDRHGHLDAAGWRMEKEHCVVRCFRQGTKVRTGALRHVGRGWRFDYAPADREDDEPLFRLDRHVIAPGLYLTVTEDDGEQRPFKIVSVQPARVAA